MDRTGEQHLVAGLRRGDRAAFDEVYARYRPRLYAFLLRLSRRAFVADDLLQETFLNLARAAPRLREDTDLRAFLFTVARNAHVSYRRWNALDVSRLVALGDAPDAAATDPAPDADLSRRAAMLERALGALPATSREVLLLVGVEGFDQEEAASILGVRYDALRQRLARARAQLVAALEREEARSIARVLSRGGT